MKLPFRLARLNPFQQAQANEEPLFIGIGRQAGFRGRWPLDVFARRFHILPPPHAVKGMRIRAEAEIRLQPPVFQVVQRFEARLSEVRDLIAGHTARAQAFNGRFIHTGDGVVIGHVERAVTHTLKQNLAAKAAVLIHLEHIDRDVRRIEALNPIERSRPTIGSLPGKTGDQIDIEVVQASTA